MKVVLGLVLQLVYFLFLEFSLQTEFRINQGEVQVSTADDSHLWLSFCESLSPGEREGVFCCRRNMSVQTIDDRTGDHTQRNQQSEQPFQYLLSQFNWNLILITFLNKKQNLQWIMDSLSIYQKQVRQELLDRSNGNQIIELQSKQKEGDSLMIDSEYMSRRWKGESEWKVEIERKREGQFYQ